MTPTWLTAFLDFPAEDYATGVAFWQAVTGFERSPARGASGEFATLVPPDGDSYLRVQRIDGGRPRLHLDVSVASPRAAADRAADLGASELADEGYVVMRSPGGLVFCFVPPVGSERPSAATWPGGHRSSVYQVCLDLPGEQYDAEARFWCAVLGAEREVLAARPEFSWLRHERQFALDFLLQATDEAAGEVRAHLDLGTNDREAEVARHVALGATLMGPEQFWTVMRDPTGVIYCITDRDPSTGRLVAATAKA